MKFFTLLLLLATLSTAMLTGCERNLISPVKDFTDLSQTTAQFAQKSLLDLADTAATRGFGFLANEATRVAEGLTIEGRTVPQTALLKLAYEANALGEAFGPTKCEIELQKFAIASAYVAKAHLTETGVNLENIEEWQILRSSLNDYLGDGITDIEHAWQNLAQEAGVARIALQQLPIQNTFIPFAFGYGSSIDLVYSIAFEYRGRLFPECPERPDYVPGIIFVQYDKTFSREQQVETRTAVIDFLDNLGFKVEIKETPGEVIIYLDKAVDPRPIIEKLITVPGIVRAYPEVPTYPADVCPPRPPFLPSAPRPRSVEIIDSLRDKYNEAWCRGDFYKIDTILLAESGLKFFNYSFVRSLADIHAEENPEAAELVRTKQFSLRSIAVEFLHIYLVEHSEKSHEDIMEIFRRLIRGGGVTIAAPHFFGGVGRTHFVY